MAAMLAIVKQDIDSIDEIADDLGEDNKRLYPKMTKAMMAVYYYSTTSGKL